MCKKELYRCAEQAMPEQFAFLEAMRVDEPLRILLVDDHPFMRDALRSVFERNKAFTVIGVAESFAAAVLAAAMTTPDVVLTDIHMQPSSGIALTRYLVRRYPGITVIGFSNTLFESDIEAMKRAGAEGVLQKGIPLEELYRTIIRLSGRGR